jgi:hypothetical protein
MSFTLFSKKSPFDEYWASKELENAFAYAHKDSNGSCIIPVPSNDREIVDNFSVIPDTIECSLFPKVLSKDTTRQYIINRKINILMIKTVNDTCKRDLPVESCPVAPSFNPDSADTKKLGNGTEYWREYHSAKENDFPETVTLLHYTA